MDAERLAATPLFRNLPAEAIEILLASATRRVFEAETVIFRHGDVPTEFYLVEHGVVDIVLPALGGDIIIATFEEGSFFGELGVFDRHQRTATARAEQDTSLYCIPLEVVENLLERYPAAAKQFMTAIIARLRSADEMLSRLRLRNANDVADETMTFGERIADAVARFGGSWTFIIAFIVFLLGWMAVNATWLLTNPPDPFPYIFLNLILSCIAALQAPVIMMSQNRQATKDRLQADLEYQVNVRAEFAIQQLHRKLDELRTSLAQNRHADRTLTGALLEGRTREGRTVDNRTLDRR